MRDLAARLQVNALTVGKAYQELEHEGLIESRCGLGMFVTPRAGRSGDLARAARRAVERTADRLALEAAQAGLSPRQVQALVAAAIDALEATPAQSKELKHGRG